MLGRFKAFQLAKVFYQRCKRLKVPDYLQRQLMRASSSVALNLAEGYGKRTSTDRKRYFTNALGSLRECEAILKMEEIKDAELEDLLDQLGAVIYTLSAKNFTRPSDGETDPPDSDS